MATSYGTAMGQTEKFKIARGSVLLRSLPEEVVNTLLADAHSRDFARGETVFLQGDDAKVVHIVLEGWVKLYRVSSNGNEAVVNVFPRGHSLGEAVALRLQPYPVSAEAVTDCTLLQISTKSFISIMKRNPEVAIAILASTFQHLHELVGQLEQIKAQTGAQRVADFLLQLCSCDAGGCSVTLPYDKALIAGRLGMKPESLSRAFSKLKGIGVHITRHEAQIDDIDILRNYAEKDPAEAWSKTS